jgi:serine O-acetyltransferase
VGAHAQLIGAIEVGEGARIGSGSVVVKNVPPYSTVVGVPGRTVAVRFPDNRPVARLPDPEAETIGLLQERVRELEGRLQALEVALAQAGIEPAAVPATGSDRPGSSTRLDPWW